MPGAATAGGTVMSDTGAITGPGGAGTVTMPRSHGASSASHDEPGPGSDAPGSGRGRLTWTRIRGLDSDVQWRGCHWSRCSLTRNHSKVNSTLRSKSPASLGRPASGSSLRVTADGVGPAATSNLKDLNSGSTGSRFQQLTPNLTPSLERRLLNHEWLPSPTTLSIYFHH